MAPSTNNEYTVVNDQICTQEEETVTTYGIAVQSDGVEEKRIPDISLDEEFIKKAVAKFNRYHLSLNQFEDAVDDLIASESTW